MVEGSHQTLWFLSLPNVSLHSRILSYTVTPLIDQTFHYIVTFKTNWTLLPFWRFYRIFRGFHRIFTMGAARQQRTVTPPDTWSCPIWNLHFFWCWSHSFVKLQCLRTMWVSKVPRFFYFTMYSFPRYYLDFASIKCSIYRTQTRAVWIQFSFVESWTLTSLTQTYRTYKSTKDKQLVWND